jgi:hypothetical protein
MWLMGVRRSWRMRDKSSFMVAVAGALDGEAMIGFWFPTG